MYRVTSQETGRSPVSSICQSRHVRDGDEYHPPIIVAERSSNRLEIAACGALPGRHLLGEFAEAHALNAPELIETALRRAISDASATLLNLHIHVFGSTGGVTATASLAESNITVHTWPEQNYAAIDVFMCGGCNPRLCLPALIDTLKPGRIFLREITRDAGGCARAELLPPL